MAVVPIWLRCLRVYCHHSPFERGKTKLVLRAFHARPAQQQEVEALLDKRLLVNLNLAFWVDFNIFCIGLYEHYLAAFFKQRLQSDTVFLDVGAYIGQYALLAASNTRSGAVYAFEPTPNSARRLRRAIEANNLRRLAVIESAVSDTTAPAAFYLTADPSSNSLSESFAAAKSVATQVSSTTLDIFCEERKLDKVDIIKIDVEGCAAQVIDGAIATLKRHAPLLFIELNPQNEQRPVDILRSLGYRLRWLDHGRLFEPSGRSLPTDNVIAIPPRDLHRFNLHTFR